MAISRDDTFGRRWLHFLAFITVFVRIPELRIIFSFQKLANALFFSLACDKGLKNPWAFRLTLLRLDHVLFFIL